MSKYPTPKYNLNGCRVFGHLGINSIEGLDLGVSQIYGVSFGVPFLMKSKISQEKRRPGPSERPMQGFLVGHFSNVFGAVRRSGQQTQHKEVLDRCCFSACLTVPV